jgi:hypothetical protein
MLISSPHQSHRRALREAFTDCSWNVSLTAAPPVFLVVVVMSATVCHYAPALVAGMARPSFVPICFDIAAVP